MVVRETGKAKIEGFDTMSEWQFDEVEDEAVEVEPCSGSCRTPFPNLVARGVLIGIYLCLLVHGERIIYENGLHFPPGDVLGIISMLVAFGSNLIGSFIAFIAFCVILNWAFGKESFRDMIKREWS